MSENAGVQEVVEQVDTEVVVESEVIEQVVEPDLLADPLDDVFPERYPLEKKVEETPVTTADKVEIAKVEEAPVTTAEPAVEEQKEPVESNETAGLKKALAAERAKRQALEAATAVKKEPVKFDWQDPDKTIEAVKADISNDFQVSLLKMSETQAESRHEDYREKEAVFINAVKENPSLYNTMIQQADPAEFAYQYAKKQMFAAEVGENPAEYKEKLEAELRTKITAEFETKAKNNDNLAASLPPSAKSLGNKTASDVVVSDPMDDLFDDFPS